jgi:hypothetical protein
VLPAVHDVVSGDTGRLRAPLADPEGVLVQPLLDEVPGGDHGGSQLRVQVLPEHMSIKSKPTLLDQSINRNQPSWCLRCSRFSPVIGEDKPLDIVDTLGGRTRSLEGAVGPVVPCQEGELGLVLSPPGLRVAVKGYSSTQAQKPGQILT